MSVEAIARAVLYEGYILWPYTRSAMKNQQRWTFGGVYPPAWEADRSAMHTEVLVEGDGILEASVRFLHVVRRDVLDASGRAVDELVADGERHVAWDEATEREFELSEDVPRVALDVADGSTREELGGGAIVRSWERLSGHAELAVERVAPGLRRVAVEVVNTSAWRGNDRNEASRHAFASTHVVLRGGAFVSLTDPPQRLRGAAAACRNDGAWPVLAGEPGARDTMLCSPIILEDWPRVAPESPGDFFDGGEIDKLLVLNVLTLTDEEKAEMRASDPRAREILERCERLTPEEMMRLHGTFRDVTLGRRP